MQDSRQAARCVTARAEGGSEIKLNTKEYFDIDTIDGMIFDIDGTLVDSDPFHHQAFQELLQPEGFNGARRATVLPPPRCRPAAHVHHAALLSACCWARSWHGVVPPYCKSSSSCCSARARGPKTRRVQTESR